ncbi:MAG: hypothetical protein WCQ96_05685 [Patescibacteria group bacterium]|jgi:hypothetical protein
MIFIFFSIYTDYRKNKKITPGVLVEHSSIYIKKVEVSYPG